MPAAVGEFGIDLVRNDQKVVFFEDGYDFFELFARHDAARRVVGIGEHERLGFGGDRRLERFGREYESVFLHAAHGNGRSARKKHAGQVGHISGVGNQNFVARLADGAQDEVDALARADRHDDVLGGIFGGKALRHISGDKLAQGGQPAVARVLGVSALDALDRRVADVPRRYKIRLAHAEGDGVLHLRHDVEKLADAARLEVFRAFIDKTFHACTEILRSLSSSAPVIVPSILYFLRMKWVAVDCTSSSVERRSETKRATSRRFLPSMNTAKS